MPRSRWAFAERPYAPREAQYYVPPPSDPAAGPSGPYPYPSGPLAPTTAPAAPAPPPAPGPATVVVTSTATTTADGGGVGGAAAPSGGSGGGGGHDDGAGGGGGGGGGGGASGGASSSSAPLSVTFSVSATAYGRDTAPATTATTATPPVPPVATPSPGPSPWAARPHQESGLPSWATGAGSIGPRYPWYAGGDDPSAQGSQGGWAPRGGYSGGGGAYPRYPPPPGYGAPGTGFGLDPGYGVPEGGGGGGTPLGAALARTRFPTFLRPLPAARPEFSPAVPFPTAEAAAEAYGSLLGELCDEVGVEWVHELAPRVRQLCEAALMLPVLDGFAATVCGKLDQALRGGAGDGAGALAPGRPPGLSEASAMLSSVLKELRQLRKLNTLRRRMA